MNIFYSNYEKIKEQDQQNVQEEDRSFGQQMYPVAIAGYLGKFIIHVFSFSGAVILPAYGFELLFGSFFIGLCVGFVAVLVFIEVPKWATIDTVFENYYESGIISYGLSVFAILLMAPSIVSSTFGVPILANKLAPAAIVISLEDIEEKYLIQKEEALGFYGPQIKKHSSDADEYFRRFRKKDRVTGEWRLSSSPKVKDPWNDMVKAGKQAQQDLNLKLESIHTSITKDLSIAVAENKITVADHNFKKDHAGNIAFWVMLLLEIGYVLIVGWLKYYKYRSKKERSGLVPNQIEPKQTEPVRIKPIQTKSNQTEPSRPTEKQQVAAKRKIGFEDNQPKPQPRPEPNQTEEFEPFLPVGCTAKRIKYKKKDGSYTEYTKAELVGQFNRPTGSDEHKKRLQRIINKFN